MKKYLAIFILMASPLAHADLTLDASTPLTVSVTGTDALTLSTWFDINKTVTSFECHKGPEGPFSPANCHLDEKKLTQEQSAPVYKVLTKAIKVIRSTPGMSSEVVSVKIGSCTAKDACTLTFKTSGGAT